MSLSILNNIISTSPYFNSHELLVHWMAKCEQHIEKLEQLLKVSTITNLISKIPREDYAFIARSPTFRIIMKSLERTANAPKQTLSKVYENLFLLFRPFLDREASQKLKFESSDYNNSLTAPYPLFVSFIINGNNDYKFELDQINKCLIQNPGNFDTKYILTNFSEAEATSIKVALRELNGVSPYLLCDIAMNVRYFAKIIPEVSDSSAMHMSLTTSFLPGICFFSDGIFTDPERIGESILHEALHMKYLQTIEIYSLHPTTYTGDTGRKFLCPWRPSGNVWAFNRAFAAFHVYSHLYIYYRALLEKGLPLDYRLSWVKSRLQDCMIRAEELRKWVDSEKEEAFTNEGIIFFHTLCDAMDAV